MKASVPDPSNGAGRSSTNGRFLGLKKSTLSMLAVITVGTPLLVACDNLGSSIPVNTEVSTTPAAPSEQTPAPTTSEAPAIETSTSKAPKPEPTSEAKPTSTEVPTSAESPEATEAPQAPDTNEPSENIPSHLKDAIAEAKDRVDNGAYSYRLIKDWLIKRKNLSEADAELVLDSSDIDWHAEALESAQKSIDGSEGISKTNLFSWLTYYSSISWIGGNTGFSEDEAFYAVENAEADWNKEAAEFVKSNLETYSPISKYYLNFMVSGEGFNREELDYGFSQLPEDTWETQAVLEARVIQLSQDPTRDELIRHLTNSEKYTDAEAEYAADQVGLTE